MPSQPALLTAGPMNLEQMSRSLRSFLFIQEMCRSVGPFRNRPSPVRQNANQARCSKESESSEPPRLYLLPVSPVTHEAERGNLRVTTCSPVCYVHCTPSTDLKIVPTPPFHYRTP